MRQVVGAEAEEFSLLRDLARNQRGAGQFDHGADQIVYPATDVLENLFRHPIDQSAQDFDLAPGRDQRDHDFRHGCVVALSCHLAGGFEDRARLHLVDFGIGNPQAASAMAEHRIEFVQLACPAAQMVDTQPARFRQLRELGVAMREKLMQRRVEQADRAGQARHGAEDRDEIRALFGQQFGERGAAALLVLGQDHLAHRADPVGIEEHMLRPAQADPLGPELARHRAVAFGLGIGADPHPAVLVSPFHQGAEIARQLGLDRRDLACHDFALRAVDGDDVAFLQLAMSDGQLAAFARDRHLRGAGDAGAAHPARHHGGVARHATARREDPLGRVHPVNILGTGFDANEDHLVAAIGP